MELPTTAERMDKFLTPDKQIKTENRGDCNELFFI